MLSLGFFIILILIFQFASLSQGQDSHASPDLVIHLFRHGARAPLHEKDADDWYSYQLGELTPVGMREHYLLGTALADAYPDILGQPFNLSKIYLRSSTLHRSIESAASQLYGVYEGQGPALNANSSYPSERAFPPYNSPTIQQTNQNLTNAQAIPGGYIPIAPNTTSDEGGVTLLEPTQVCFNLVDDIIENVISEESFDLWKDLAPTRQALSDAGLSANNPYTLGTLGDVFVCDFFDDRPLPGNIDPNSEVYLNVTFARNWYFMRALWGAEQQRQLLSVPIFNYVFDYLDQKAAGTTELEFMFLSSAETNLIDLLATLNILTPECLMDNYRADLSKEPRPHANCNYTEFASSILFEFYNNSGSSTVVFKYNGVAIPVCSDNVECPYNDFKNFVNQATNRYTPDDYQRDCLGRTLPEFEKIFEKVGDAFEAKYNDGDSDIKGILSEITGDDNGEENGLGDIIDNAVESIGDKIDSIKDHIGDIFHHN